MSEKISSSQRPISLNEALDAQVKQLKQELAHMEARIASAEFQLRQKDAEVHRLKQTLLDLQTEMRELFVENQKLRFWLSRYKAIKDKYLRRGSFQERAAKWIAQHLIKRRARRSNARIRSSENEAPRESRAHEVVVEPPRDWKSDPSRPPVAIIIPNWNRVELLRSCLDSIFAHTTYEPFRICVYDQGSTDGSKQYLQSLGNRVDAILADENAGFIKANNAMLGRYLGWDVVFLNNDTEVTEGWLEPLLETAYKSDKTGLVAPKLVYPYGLLQEAGSQVFQDGSCRAYGRYESPSTAEFNQLREADYGSAACLYVKRSVLDLTGGFDELYSPAYYEDADLAFKARSMGFKTLYEPRSTVVHHEYSSSGQTAFELMEVNRLKFLKKWKAALTHQQRNFWEARTLDQREKVFVISEVVPAPDRSSGGTRLYEFVRLLARHYHIVFAYLGPEASRDYVKPLERVGATVFYRGYAKAVHNYEVDIPAILQSNKFKFVFCELMDTAEQFLDTIREHSPESSVVIDTYDVHFVREMRQAEISSDPSLKEKAERTKKRELQIYAGSDLVLTVTEEDRQALVRENPRLNVAVVSNIHVLPDVVAPRSTRRDLLFVGGFTHQPNVDAVLYFCRDIFPEILNQIAGAKLYIIGNASPAEVVALGSDKVIVTGYVANLVPYLTSTLVAVVPLRFGSGMKGKIGEAMAYGLPVVTTSIGAEGMGLVDGIDAMIADKPREFVSRTVQLYTDLGLWTSIAEAAWRHVRREWSPEAVGPRLTAILANQTGRRSRKMTGMAPEEGKCAS